MLKMTYDQHKRQRGGHLQLRI